MERQTVVWTALPRHAHVDGLELAVFVSPRLETDGATQLHEFPDFITWTRTVAKIDFRVEFREGNTFGPNEITRLEPALVPEFWEALFNSGTRVVPYVFDDYSTRKYASFSVVETLAFIKRQYQKVATQSATDLPLISFLLNQTDADGNANRESFANLAPRNKKNKVGSFANVQRFYQPLNVRRRVELPATDEELRCLIDFHQAVSALGDYPELLSRLGLVIKLAVRFPEQISHQSAIPASGFVRVVPQWSSQNAGHMDFSPWTAYEIKGSLFSTRSRTKNEPDEPSDIQSGMLKLNPPSFELVQVDVDGAALKAVNFAESLQNMAEGGTIDSPKEAGVPTLRSSGISVVKNGRAKAFQASMKLPATYEKAVQAKRDVLSAATTGGANPEDFDKQVELFADDLVRGYRIDVFDKGWHSLCERAGSYFFMKGNEEARPWRATDEGFVQMAVTAAAGSDSTDLRLHESLFHWDGWSLCAPKPGKHVGNKGEAASYDDPNDPQNNEMKAKAGFDLVTSFKAKENSLPRLRFGREYRLRARTVDLAGHSLNLDEAGSAAASNPIPYLRFEPVAAPAVVLDKEHKPAEYPGESLEHVVIRSNFDKTTVEYSADFKKISPGYHAAARRLIAPPKCTQLFAEMHGKFDDLDAVKSFFQLILTREAGTFPAAKKAGTDEPDDPNLSFDPIAPPDPRQLPYLPDPFARGATFRMLPGAAQKIGRAMPHEPDIDYQPLASLEHIAQPAALGSIVQIGFARDEWPWYEPFFIELVEGSNRGPAVGPEPRWNADERVLTVTLAKARHVTIRLSSFLGFEKPDEAEDLNHMGIWQWIAETPKTPDVNLEELKALALLGLHWMITPYRELTLVHAVQQPLAVPVLGGSSVKQKEADKDLGETFAMLDCWITLDAKSTSKYDLLARWDDPVDPLNKAGWEVLQGHAHVFESQVPLGQNDFRFGIIERTDNRIRHEFGDTRYRKVFYRLVATSRFREYFEFTGDAAGSSKALDFTRESEEVVVEVKNSARPAAPKVLYVVPLFGWEKSASDLAKITRKRKGALRVYLERPWFSSGADERLGVILFGENDPGDLERFKPYITQWGNDPVWGAPDVPALLPQRKHFPGRIIDEDETALSIDETRDLEVAVASHKVEFDAERELWFCDIEIDTGKAYFPFIRLALARFQPHSVSDAHLSRIVLADFAQVVPDRSVTIKRKPTLSFPFNEETHVVINGLAYDRIRKPNGQAAEAGSTFAVAIERLDPDIGGELDWVPYGSPEPSTIIIGPSPGHPALLWEGVFTLSINDPKDPPGRLVIKEYESWYDDRMYTLDSEGTPQPFFGPPSKRLVFADVIPLEQVRLEKSTRVIRD